MESLRCSTTCRGPPQYRCTSRSPFNHFFINFVRKVRDLELNLLQAASDGSLWAMDRQTFRKIVLKSAFQKRKMYESFLENVELLKHLEVENYFVCQN